MVSPLFNNFNEFADKIYSTLWNNALNNKLSNMLSRTPWNYAFVIDDYLLAILPTLSILANLFIVIYRFVRQPSAEWFILLGISATVLITLIFITLRITSYA